MTHDDRQFGASEFRQYSSLAVRKLFKPPSELIQLPLFGQCGCLVPSRLLATEARQRRSRGKGRAYRHEAQYLLTRKYAPI